MLDVEDDSSERMTVGAAAAHMHPPVHLAVKEFTFFDWSKAKLRERNVEQQPQQQQQQQHVAELDTSRLADTVAILSVNARKKKLHSSSAATTADPQQVAQTISIKFT